MSDETKTEVEAPFDASDKNAVQKRTADAKRKEAKRLNGLKQLCDSADGRAWLWELLKACGFSRTSFSPEPATMAFREGERNVALRILAEISRVSPDTYLKMQKENSSDE